MKYLFKCTICGDIHFGSSAPEECPTCQSKKSYIKTEKEDVDILLNKLINKKLGRCTVCNDLHIGKMFSIFCPTCKNENVYVEIDKAEFEKIID